MSQVSGLGWPELNTGAGEKSKNTGDSVWFEFQINKGMFFSLSVCHAVKER